MFRLFSRVGLCPAFSLTLFFFQFGSRLLFYQKLNPRRKLRNHLFVLIQRLKWFEFGGRLRFRLLATFMRVRC